MKIIVIECVKKLGNLLKIVLVIYNNFKLTPINQTKNAEK
tara:strand:+ start:355 stop:474 length:120 start_codon:yes stop_codon:yes gene_type:complete